MVHAYIHDGEDNIDLREPHNTGKDASLDDLGKLGVIYKFCGTQEQVDAIALERSYKNRDVVNISLGTFKNDNKALMDKLEIFYTEHLHEDEEIRYCLDGSGYFDVRGADDKDWIRCKVNAGDLLILPAGIYHRFTLTSDNYIKALRLFKNEPKWNAINRPNGDDFTVRKEYLSQVNK